MFANLYHYRATVIDVRDGNICMADIELGFNLYLRSVSLQLNRIVTPKAKNNSAKKTLKKILQGKMVTLETIENRKGGYSAEIWIEDNSGKRTNVNDLLVEKKLANYLH